MLKDEAMAALAAGDMDKLRRLADGARGRAQRVSFDPAALMREVESARRALGISQSQVMTAIGRPRAVYTRLATGTGPSAQTALRLMAWLGQTDIRSGVLPVDADPDPLDGAMHAMWIRGSWRQLTGDMTTREREAAADAVARYSAYLNAGTDRELLDEPDGLRWWRHE